jgi:hypothetical protein
MGGELGREAREAEFPLEGQAIGVWGEEEVGLAVGEGAESGTSREAEEGGEVGSKIRRGSLGNGSREAAEVFAAKVSAEMVEGEVKDQGG